MINPAKLIELKKLKDEFANSHPKFHRFLHDMAHQEIKEGTVIEIQIKSENGKVYCSNLRVTESDLRFIESLKELNS